MMANSALESNTRIDRPEKGSLPAQPVVPNHSATLPPPAMLKQPRFLGETLLNFLRGWLFSRNHLRFFLAMPAILLIGALVIHWLAPQSRRLELVIQRYEKELKAARQREDISAQEVLLNTLMQAEPNEPRHRYRMALLRVTQDRPQAAWVIMNSLAPLEEPGGFLEAHLWLAESLFQQSDPNRQGGAWAAATRHLQRVLEQEPNHHRAHELLAEIYVRSQEPALAEPHLEQAATHQPKHRLLLAQIQMLRGSRERAAYNARLAETALRDAAAEDAADAAARVGWAQALELQGRLFEAEQVLRQGWRTAPDPLIAAHLSRLLVRLVDSESRMGLALPKRHLTRLEEALQLDPLNLAALDLLSQMEHVELGDAEQLLAAAEQRIRETLAEAPNRPELHLMLSKIRALRGETDEALAELRCAASLQPAYSLTLAKALDQSRHKSEAVESALLACSYFRQIVERDPSNVEARLHWAEAEILAERWASARSILSAGAHRNPDPRLQRAIADLYVRAAGRLIQQAATERALDLLSKAVDVDATHLPALTRLAGIAREGGSLAPSAKAILCNLLSQGKAMLQVHSLLGANASVAGEFEEARRHLEQAYYLNATDPVVCNNLAHTLANLPEADLDRALALVDQALQFLPGHQEVLETRGEVLLRQQRWHEAIHDLEAALPLSAHPQRLHQRLAEAYAALGDLDVAQRHRQLTE